MPRLARLSALADLVLPGRPMADIGTDHARLPLGLVQTGRVPMAIGIDLRPGPLRQARQSLQAAGLDGDPRIELRLGDGLAPLSPGEVATVVIAGMGGCRILDLLQAPPSVNPSVLAGLSRLVLQPNTDLPLVRAGLVALGWQIIDERVVWSGRQAFTLIAAQPQLKTDPPLALSPAELQLGPVLLKRRSAEFLRWLDRERLRLERCLTATPPTDRAAEPLARRLDRVHQALNRPTPASGQ